MIKQNVTLSEEKSHAAKIKLENSQNQKSIETKSHSRETKSHTIKTKNSH